MKHLLLSISFVFIFLSGQAQDAQVNLIEKANQAYNNGSFTEAIDQYQAVVESGYVSAALFYNLGNAYFKSRDIPSAILYYEKALKINPRDEQARFNLNIANSQITDKIEAVPEMFYLRWWKSFTGLFSPGTWARLSIVLFISMMALVTLFTVTQSLGIRRGAFWAGLVVILLMVTSFYVAYQKHYHLTHDNYAIIFTPTVTVKSSPAKNSVDLFVIHEGTKVEILDKVEGWYEIKIVNGSIGWLPNDVLRKI
jgi:tetratricopeptide (TPR) repeat protein